MRALSQIGRIEFPRPTGALVNMMPFIMGDSASLPKEYRQYAGLIEACGLEPAQLGKVGYLSINETFIAAGQTQRRAGIHTDKLPTSAWGGGGWGKGSMAPKGRMDGLYVASTVDRSCRAWDLSIDHPGLMGNCEHLRVMLETEWPASYMAAHTLYWMTDSCPHESLPLSRRTFRQWFRLVTNKVDLWYERHSTTNPLGVIAPCEIVKADKFIGGHEDEPSPGI
jgi:hypothetical protein